MKKLGALLIVAVLITACTGKTDPKKLMTKSYGAMGSLAVVIENDLWEGNVGDGIREIFAAETLGLPQVEPLFSLLQVPPNAFTGHTKNYRNALVVKKGNNVTFGIQEDTNATPQKIVYVIDSTEEKIIENIKGSQKKIINTFRENDIKESQQRFKVSLNREKEMSENFGVSLLIPSLYKLVRTEPKFLWFQKEIKQGSQNILIYEMPMNSITNDSTVVTDIIKMRDSIGKQFIPGKLEGTYMITEEAYAPYVFDAILDNKNAIETRGTWEVKGNFMAGPFLNYIIEDKNNDRLLVIEGFTFAPSVGKRDFMLELEAILRSVKVKS